MSKHTPGPWEVDSDGDVIANGEDVAHVVVAYYGEEENLANAHLIAAAPDLLAALVDAGKALSADTSESSLAQRIRAAIAKAEGC